MNPFEQMEMKKSAFTKTEMEVYQIFQENVDDILRDSATTIAEKYSISQPAITRFCQKIGYQGFNEFKYDVYQYCKTGQGNKDITSIIDYYCKLIQLIPGAISSESFTLLSQRLIAARCVFLLGIHKSSLPAQLLEINLGKVGILAVLVPYAHTDSIINRAVQDDVVLIFSAVSGSYRNDIDAINDMPPSRRPLTVLVTQSDKHPIRNKVDQVIWLPSYRNQGYAQYLEAQIVPMIFVDLLTSYITANKKEEGTR